MNGLPDARVERDQDDEGGYCVSNKADSMCAVL